MYSKCDFVSLSYAATSRSRFATIGIASIFPPLLPGWAANEKRRKAPRMGREGVVPSSHFLLKVDDVANRGLLTGPNRIHMYERVYASDAHLLYIREAVQLLKRFADVHIVGRREEIRPLLAYSAEAPPSAWRRDRHAQSAKRRRRFAERRGPCWEIRAACGEPSRPAIFASRWLQAL